MAHKWMKNAFAGAHGQFKAKAQAAGKSTAEFASEHAHSPGKVGAQARLALVGMGKSIPEKPKPRPVAERRYGNGS